MSSEDEKSQKMRLREEIENPFRKVRFFVFYSFIGSASVGLLIALVRLAALSKGIDQGQTANELLQNIAINISAIGILAFLVRRDILAQNSRLQRMEIGAKLASLKVSVQDENEEKIISLAGFRRRRGIEKRVCIIVGGKEGVNNSLKSALNFSQSLISSDIVIVPLVVEQSTGNGNLVCGGMESQLESAVGKAHIALPLILNSWQEWVQSEIETAQSQGFDVLNDGFAVILKKNGKIGTRSKGFPPWDVIVGNVQARADANFDTTNI
eukprot:CAMPEP_0171462338 /NCGR_PEP_ID=MMETSP0945-20130129/6414_1 /TAXON_ID=109269 /ORGANISM="Vaucheria litorea, Strain CCMP2940" /LENGTH=267 /DNA_ID=CAMNT_0011988841 /DNA_START=123 /DNA_END=926 /DNA_ORIENTATION=-